MRLLRIPRFALEFSGLVWEPIGTAAKRRSNVGARICDAIGRHVDAINRPAEFMAGKKLIRAAIPVDRAKLADESVAPKDLVE